MIRFIKKENEPDTNFPTIHRHKQCKDELFLIAYSYLNGERIYSLICLTSGYSHGTYTTLENLFFTNDGVDPNPINIEIYYY